MISSAKIACAALVVSLLSLPALVQSEKTAQVAVQSGIQFSPPTPPDPGEPSDRGQGGGHRGNCDKKYSGLTALVPSPRPNLPDDRWGLTVSDRPTIWFNVPTGINAGTLVEWKLRDAKGKTIYRKISRLPQTAPGVIGFSIPATVPLAIATYQWDLAIYCDSTSSDSSSTSDSAIDQPLVRKGRIQRLAVPQALQRELAAAKTPLERAELYAKYSIWYDALTTLGTQIRSARNPDQAVLNAWRELLQQQKLEGAAATVTACCTL